MRKGYKMISNQILQNTMEGLKNISKVDMGVLDVEGKVLVSTFPESEIAGEEAAAFRAVAGRFSDKLKIISFLRSMTSISWSTYLLPEGDSDETYLVGKWLPFSCRAF